MPGAGETVVTVLKYPATGSASPVATTPEFEEDFAGRVRELEMLLESKERQFVQKLEAATREAMEQGRRLAGAEQAAWRQDCAGQLKTAIEQFRGERDQYIARVEHEVVRLALAIAERILHREAQMDPMLLSGTVRVALGQLAESTEVRLRVPAAHKELWAEMMRLMPGLPLRPEVQADEGLKECEAVLEADLGAADLSVRAQLSEIERSFFDAQGTPDASGAASDPAESGRRGR